VPGWGLGELWHCDGVVLAHDFHFETVLEAVSDTDVDGRLPMPNANVREEAMADDVKGRSTASLTCGGIGTGSLEATLDTKRCLTPDVLIQRIRGFLAGGGDDFSDVELELGWATRFQRALATSLRDLPRGEVVSYGELAALAGRPGAARAAGAFCASNRFAFLVPCHRVVAAQGIGGYGEAGVEVKRRLLALEGVFL
jgi:methylated-DNA-[protein]-cysteine S-methyltransferase